MSRYQLKAYPLVLLLYIWVFTNFVAASCNAQEPQKFAVLIGNQNYARAVGALQNPHRDIALVADALSSQGFTVLPLVKDAVRSQILDAARNLVQRLNDAGPNAIGLLYYSGHGAAKKNTDKNYLIPIDAKSPGSSSFWDNSVKLDDILMLLDGVPNAAKFVVFDACRNELQLPERTADKGLVVVPQRQGMFIAYSTAPGHTASDVGQRSGPYAAAFAAELSLHLGQDHLNLFQNIKEHVLQATGDVQQPWESNGLARRVYITGRSPSPSRGSPRVQSPQESERLDENEEKSFAMRTLEALGTRDPLRQVVELMKLKKEKEAREHARQVQRRAALEERRFPERSTRPGSGEIFRDTLADGDQCDFCPHMVIVPEGEFLMGSAKADIDSVARELHAGSSQFRSETPQTKVRIRESFAVSMTLITRGQFAAFARATGRSVNEDCGSYEMKNGVRVELSRSSIPSGVDIGDENPVVCVNWIDVTAYTEWLSTRTGKPYRLLSEAEAEYAIRATINAEPRPRYFFGNDASKLCEYANGADQTLKETSPSWPNVTKCRDQFAYTSPVGKFKPNDWGLLDAHGNASTWTLDCWNESHSGHPGDASARANGDCNRRVIRGGSWLDSPMFLRAAYRTHAEQSRRLDFVGFRVARAVSP